MLHRFGLTVGSTVFRKQENQIKVCKRIGGLQAQGFMDDEGTEGTTYCDV